ncbi:class IV adenylate cyclase [Pirellulaceae bacterium SH449]
MQPLEAECKFRVVDQSQTKDKLIALGATFVRTEEHCDTYLRHPSRDFRVTDEALRIRQINEEAYVTYKGKRLEGPIKIRPEIELKLESSTIEGWFQIWENLGFERVRQVKKSREIYEISGEYGPMTVTLDEVFGLGFYAEIERILIDASQIAKAQSDIAALSSQLGLGDIEKRSYLSMLLGQSEKIV